MPPSNPLKGCATCAHYGRVWDGQMLRPACVQRGPAAYTVAQWHGTHGGRRRYVPPCPGWTARPPTTALPMCGARSGAPGTWCVLRAGHSGAHGADNGTKWTSTAARQLRNCSVERCVWKGPLHPGEHCACGNTCGTPWGEPVSGLIPVVSDLRLAYNISAPFVVRVEYVQGGSEKFYELASDPVLHGDRVVRRWGRIGSTGQSMDDDADSAFGAFSGKLADGYRLRASGVPGAARAPMPQVDPVQQLVNALRNVTQRGATVAELSDMALRGGWENEGDAPEEVLRMFPRAQVVRLYRSTDARWAVVRYEDGTRTFGKLKQT